MKKLSSLYAAGALFFLLQLPGMEPARAQMLEQVSFNNSDNTYLLDINDAGYVCGYHSNPSGYGTGFIRTPAGKMLLPDLPAGYLGTKVTGINDHGVAVMEAAGISGKGQFKIYLDTELDSIVRVVDISAAMAASGLSAALGTTISKINNLNGISGWYKPTGYRFLFTYHDSIMLGGDPKTSSAYDDGATVYNTMAGGVNDANRVAGFYFNGTDNFPVVYDNTSRTFTKLISATSNCRLWDINNGNEVVGEYKSLTGTWKAFRGRITGPPSLAVSPLDGLFKSSSTQSVANGISNSGDIVGSFLDPADGLWKGFVYHPHIAEYRLPGFNFATDTWSMKNGLGDPDSSIFTSKYWGRFDYNSSDPFIPAAGPLLDTNTYKSLNSLYSLSEVALFASNEISPSWDAFLSEYSQSYNLEKTTNPLVVRIYQTLLKTLYLTKYKNLGYSEYNGYCYGFTYTALLRHFNDSLFAAWYGLPRGTDISAITNSDTTAVKAISRMHLKQQDVNLWQKQLKAESTARKWNTVYTLKHAFLQPKDVSNPSGLGHYEVSPVDGKKINRHMVLPYKIRTSRKLPFVFDSSTKTYEGDTIFVYDNNQPGDSSRYIIFAATNYKDRSSSGVLFSGSLANFLLGPPIRSIFPVEHAFFKTTAAADESPALSFSIGGGAYYALQEDTGTLRMDASGFSGAAPHVSPEYRYNDSSGIPAFFRMDTLRQCSGRLYRYSDSFMYAGQHNTHYAMMLTRKALPGEQDQITYGKRHIAYGNPDAATKLLNGNYIQTSEDLSTGANILARDICALSGDSVVTQSPYPYAYEIRKVGGSDSCTYTLSVHAIYGDSVKSFAAEVTLTPNTSHTIDPYGGPGGRQTVIYVDKGLTGSSSDTLFLEETTGIDPVQKASGSIRVQPNPVDKDLSIHMAAVGSPAVHISLYSITGSRVYDQTADPGKGTFTVPMGSLQPGLYILRITDDQQQLLFTEKITKR